MLNLDFYNIYKEFFQVIRNYINYYIFNNKYKYCNFNNLNQ